MSNVLNQNNNVAYGLGAPSVNVFQRPIVSKRSPTTKDLAPLGTLWVNKATSQTFVVGSIAAGAATWLNLAVNGGVGIFNFLTANTALSVGGDVGVGSAGFTTFTNDIDVNQSTGTLSIKSDSANNGDNLGFIKVYVGTQVAWIPFFTNIAP